MSLGRVYVTRPIPKAGIDLLRQECDVTIFEDEDRLPTKEEVIQGVQGKDALLSLLTEEITAEIMDAAPGLKVISNYAVGFNNIDVEAATARGIVVTNTPGVLTETTADFAWALLMAIARQGRRSRPVHPGGQVSRLGAAPVPWRRSDREVHRHRGHGPDRTGHRKARPGF